jgi:hypothetical protein
MLKRVRKKKWWLYKTGIKVALIRKTEEFSNEKLTG